jgi:chromosome partitioning protein
LSIGAGLRQKDFRVLFVDLDAQGNLSLTLGATAVTTDIFDTDSIQSTPEGDILPSTPALATADTVLSKPGREYQLREALEEFRGQYDYIIVDTPPALGILTINALVAANGIIIPTLADPYSLQGISQLYDSIQTVRKWCNPDLEIMGILLTRFSPMSIIRREIAELLDETAGQMGTKLYRTRIREGVAVQESQANKQSVLTYAPTSRVAKDYDALIDEILERN